MSDWLIEATDAVVLVAHALARVLVAIGSVEAFFRGLQSVLSSQTGHLRRDVWLRYARWLVAALTFQLGADIAETAVAATWNEVWRLGMIAVIRTFLDFFLERDIQEERAHDEELLAAGPPSPAPIPAGSYPFNPLDFARLIKFPLRSAVGSPCSRSA